MFTKLIATICYYMQLHRFAYYLNKNRKRIITFHNVLTDDVFVSNVAYGVSNSLSQFKMIIDEISKYFTFSLDIDDPKTITITFDDGYCNQVEIAAPYLIKKGIPAYLFICGQLYPNSDEIRNIKEYATKPLTVDLLLHWISYVPNGTYNICINNTEKEIEVSDSNRLEIWVGFIWPEFMKDSISKGRNLLDALNLSYPIDNIMNALSPYYLKQRLGIATLEQINFISSKGWYISWHTFSHYPLSKLTLEEKIKELTPDNRIKSKVISYPYGGINEVDSECLKIVEQLQYNTAVSNICKETLLSGKWFRSRMSLSPDPIMLHFELTGLKHLIKYGKLLPKK